MNNKLKGREKKLSNEEIAKVFAMYWGCKFWDTKAEPSEEIISIDSLTSGNTVWDTDGNDIPVNEVRLLLKPLSKITDEDAGNVYTIASGENKIGVGVAKYVQAHIFHYTNKTSIFQYLVSLGYAVPLWFGIDHWANGKTAIELNLAIESPTTVK